MTELNVELEQLRYLMVGVADVQIVHEIVIGGVTKYDMLKLIYEDGTYKYVGPLGAYGIAKANGYTGDYEDFEENLTESAQNAQSAAASAASAASSVAGAVKYTAQTLTTAQKTQARTNIGAAEDGSVVHYTAETKTDSEKEIARTNIGAGTYSKPSGGIPSSDLASAVTASLARADNAPQKSSGSTAGDTIYDWALGATKPAYTASEVTDALSAKKFIVTIPIGGWTESSGVYTKTIAVTGMTASGEAIADLSKTASTTSEEIAAWNKISSITTNDGSITLACVNGYPTVQIAVKILVVSGVVTVS